jgi:hypothetical protein
LDECEGSANNDSTIIPFFIEVQWTLLSSLYNSYKKQFLCSNL